MHDKARAASEIHLNTNAPPHSWAPVAAGRGEGTRRLLLCWRGISDINSNKLQFGYVDSGHTFLGLVLFVMIDCIMQRDLSTFSDPVLVAPLRKHSPKRVVWMRVLFNVHKAPESQLNLAHHGGIFEDRVDFEISVASW